MLKNVGSNWMLNAATIVVGFILPPLLIHTLGIPKYGEWSNVVALTGFLSLLMLGVPMATVKEFSRLIADKDQDRLNRSIASAMWLYLMMGLAAIVTGLALYGFFDRVYVPKIVKDLGDRVATEARAAFIITILQVAFGFASQVPAAILTAHREFFLRNIISIGGMLLRLALVVLWLRADASLATLAWIHTLQMVIESAITAILVIRRYPGTKLFGALDRAEVKSIVSFSVYVVLLSVGYKLIFATSSPILRAFRTTEEVTAFAQAQNLVNYLTDFVFSIGVVAMPVAIRLRVEKRDRELADMFLQWSKVALSMALFAGLYLVVIGGDFLRVWINKADFDATGAGLALSILMLSHFVFLPIRGVALPILMAIGEPRRPTIAYVITGVVYLGVAILLVRPFGMLGVASAIAACDVAFALYVMKLACDELGVSVQRYVGYVAGKAALASIPVVLLLWVLKRTVVLDGWVPVLGVGVVSTALFIALWLAFVYRNDPYIDAAGRLKRLIPFARRRPT